MQVYQQTKELLVQKAESKVLFMERSFNKYCLSAMMAGIYVGLAYFFTFAVGSAVKQSVDGSLYKIAIAMFFPIALQLIIFVGAELFTGNNMLMATGTLDKKITFMQTLKLWLLCYLGNLVGSILIAIIFYLSDSMDQSIRELIVSLTYTKTNYTVIQMFFKGILCNFMVCLGALCAYTMKDEVGKILMMSICVVAFVSSGYEHSIANMSLFSIAWLVDQGTTLDLFLYGKSFLWVTLGNILGGSILGIVYFYLGNESQSQ